MLLAACGPSGSGDVDGSVVDGADHADAWVVIDATPPADAFNEHLGDPCDTAIDCPDGYCVEGPDGNVCTFECEDSCPTDYSCRVVSVDGELVSLCVPVVPRYCFPCTDDDQCPGGACIELEGAGYCLASCFESMCPDGYTCGDDPSGEHPDKFCIPNTGSCTCTPDNVGEIRTCSVENAVGTCWGTEICDLDQGWINCTAATAEPEVCDGIDNDCNQLIDDGLGGDPCTNEVPGVGSCDGTAICAGAAGIICQAPTPSPEVCNYADDNCNGVADEGFDGLGDVCSDGIGACERFGVMACTGDGTGVECSAVAGDPTDELCNGADDNCEGHVDETFPTLGEVCVVGLGICERQGEYVCKADGTGVECSATPGPSDTEICNTLDDNCDGQIDEGYLNQITGQYDQDTACGSCAVDCTVIYDLPNASGSCIEAATPYCQMDCDPNDFNLNGYLADGCEFVLDPDAIYVATGDPHAADDASCGLGPYNTVPGYHPCKSIGQGIARANALTRGKVLVANGIYDEPVTIPDGISLLGGYLWDTWERDVAATGTMITGVSSDGNHDTTVTASGAYGSVTVFEGFVVLGSVNGKASGNSYAIYVSGANSNLTLRDNLIIAGRGGPGNTGSLGSDGTVGVAGTGRTSNPTGYDAEEMTTTPCTESRSYANGGVSACAGNGGAGGGTFCPPAPTATPGEYSGHDGANGVGALAGTGGDAGDDMVRWDGAYYYCWVPVDPDYGADGLDGGHGTDGPGVGGCTAPAGSVSGGHWVGGSAPAGNAGGGGSGGGGGGAGGGAHCDSCNENHDRLGGVGGGGGSGGCGAGGGGGATAGGAAFGIFVTNGSAPTITDNDILQGEGGTGGVGGAGGEGGVGGTGAAGGTSTVFCAGRAGRGGNGGRGGHGAGGGGGCGGGSYGIYTSGIGTPSYCGANTVSGGASGDGGAGGYSLVNPGGAGTDGQLQTCSYH